MKDTNQMRVEILLTIPLGTTIHWGFKPTTGPVGTIKGYMGSTTNLSNEFLKNVDDNTITDIWETYVQKGYLREKIRGTQEIKA